MKQTKEKICNDKHCPFHGTLKVRGQMFEGIVIKANSPKTIQIEFQRLFQLPKYERYEKRRTRIHAHKPDCMDVKVGDKVKVRACRPISKTKNFVVISVGGNYETDNI